MQGKTSWARPRGMVSHRRIRGLAATGLLCAVLAGCGSAATAALTGAGAPAMPTVAPEVGCASVNQATTVTVERHLLVGEPVNGGLRTVTQRNATLVRRLFRDFCAAVTHPEIRQPLHLCPADFGVSYTGTFYDRKRILATFSYNVSGCPRVSITAAGKTESTLLIGRAAAAAPHLKADFAAVLRLPESQVYGSPGSQIMGPGKQGM
jgi:hypothetical protein